MNRICCQRIRQEESGREVTEGGLVGAVSDTSHSRGQIQVSRPTQGTLLLELSGSWTVQSERPAVAELQRQLEAEAHVERLTFDTQHLGAWDSTLLTFLRRIEDICERRQITVDRAGLPEGIRRLLDLAAAVPERREARRGDAGDTLLARIGKGGLEAVEAARQMLEFLGESFLAFLRLLRGRASFRASDLFLLLQECGAQALPIVTLISFLVGAILAFIGAVQLQQFGAQIYVANLVGLAMALEMGAMMTAIIMAGRTGAAFAAQLGTMQVNQEIDALTTLGISPMEFLVIPRMLALVLMVPLLTVYADLMGMLGGAVIAATMLDVSFKVFFQQLQEALTLKYFAQGLIKSAVYGVIIALSGCMRGIQSGRSAAAVGQAATSAVVTSIVGIIVASAILTVIYLQVW
jgi:phospholipid/cholesterol/gamma-HCH transport system permease protein